ncbi:uncharacterized protein EV422DRAFT_488304, partial [Fimicolochytrium jonesii]|uniref:uncharacterized protein n=1 Tax=Fimicolochytrium jonesii TaxID=1396493 RepID=UPI0022FE5B0A
VKSIAKQYGLAWLLVSQILSWSNLLLIYLFLRAAQPDVTGFVKNYNLGHYAETVAETGGTFALAVLCNKVLSPLRFFVCLVIVRRTAGRLNPWLERKWAGWKRWRGTDVEAVPRED